MAEEKLNTGSEGAVLGSTEAETTIPVPETDGPPAPGGDVVVDADTIERLMAERRAAAREEVEQNELNTDAPGHEEQTEATNPPSLARVLRRCQMETAPHSRQTVHPQRSSTSPQPVGRITGSRKKRTRISRMRSRRKSPAAAVLPRKRAAQRQTKRISPAKAVRPRRRKPPRNKARQNETKCPKVRTAKSRVPLPPMEVPVPLLLRRQRPVQHPAPLRTQRSFT